MSKTDVVESESDQLSRLELYQVGGLPNARRTGAMIERLAQSYRVYSASNPDIYDSELTIDEIKISSLLVFFKDVFELGSAAISVYEHRDLLAGFVAQLSDTLDAIRTGISNGFFRPMIPAHRNIIVAMADPVNRREARQVTLKVEGDNNTILILDSMSAADVQAFVRLLNRQRPRSLPSEDEPRPVRNRVRKKKAG